MASDPLGSLQDAVQRTGNGLLHRFESLPPALQWITCGAGAGYGVNLLSPGSQACSWYNTVSRGRVHTLFTSALAHQGLLHFGFNVYFLANVGPSVYGMLARKDRDMKFCGLFAGSCVAGNAAALAYNRTAGILRPTMLHQSWMGMSGGLFALFAASVAVDPGQRLRLFGLPEAEMEAQTLLAGVVAFDAAALLFCTAVGRAMSLGHHVHLCGAGMGYAYGVNELRPRKRWWW
eukprot:TRINITY_DN6442_c0_g2_i1.p1 TRINITY_DN6442_c0_g2~~TRINITY_DN6442_c0_g2_i1.p1  ORF type:complete len:252 (+),score=59.48 TRINITY_DN6442_c0_g2_i1:58-756(+)